MDASWIPKIAFEYNSKVEEMWEVQETDRPCEVEEAKALTLLKEMTMVIFGLIMHLVKQH